jgi:hypothetical protein
LVCFFVSGAFSSGVVGFWGFFFIVFVFFFFLVVLVLFWPLSEAVSNEKFVRELALLGSIEPLQLNIDKAVQSCRDPSVRCRFVRKN